MKKIETSNSMKIEREKLQFTQKKHDKKQEF